MPAPVNLGVIRLSVFRDDAQTGPVRQRKAITEKYAALGVAEEDITWVEDLDISAFHVPPLKRPALARAFNSLPPGSVVVFYRLDRFVRRVFPDFSDMISFGADKRLSLQSATEQLDLSGPMGTMVATIIAFIAEIESRNTGIRVADTRRHLRKIGRWSGGQPPYGYRPFQVEGKPGWYLEVDLATAPFLREIVRRAVDGHSVNSIAKWLNDEEVLTPQDHFRVTKRKPDPRMCQCGHSEHYEPCDKIHKCRHRRLDGNKRFKLHEYDECSETCETYVPRTWKPEALTKMLRSPGMCGYSVTNRNEIVVNDQGDQVKLCEDPIVDYEDYLAIQTRLDAGGGPRRTGTRTQTDSLLLNVAYHDCGSPLYIHHLVRQLASGEKVYVYYRPRASQCSGELLIPAATLNALVERELMDTLGDLNVLREENAWESRTEAEIERKQVSAEIMAMTQEMFVQGKPRENHDEKMAELQDRHAELTKIIEDAGIPQTHLVDTGVKFRARWEESDTLGRRLWLMDAGVRVVACRGKKPPIEFGKRQKFKRSMIVASEDDVHAVIYLGNMGEMLRRAESVPPAGKQPAELAR